MSKKLYNNALFPQRVFRNEVKYYSFIPFHSVFKIEFLKKLKIYLDDNSIKTITILNIEPEKFKFFKTIETDKFIDSFLNVVNDINTEQNYINDKLSFYMLTDKGILYSDSDEYCIYLDREFDIAIIGFAKKTDKDYFTEFEISDILEYVQSDFENPAISKTFSIQINQNWPS